MSAMEFPTEDKHPTTSDFPCEWCDMECPEACKDQQQIYGCHACARIGCWARSRACLFYSRGRPSYVDAGMGDNVPHMNETAVQIFAGGAEFLRGAKMQSHWQRGHQKHCLRWCPWCWESAFSASSSVSCQPPFATPALDLSRTTGPSEAAARSTSDATSRVRA
jgi:hypothetical protein